MLELRASNNDVVEPYVHKFPNAQFFAGKKPWEVKVDIAMPCATQNELDGEDAKKLLANGVKIVAEVSNMGCRPEAIDAFIAAKRNTTGRPRRSMPSCIRSCRRSTTHVWNTAPRRTASSTT